MLAALSRSLEARDPSAAAHALRVTALAEAVALRLAWTAPQLEELRLGARLHDVGKLLLRESLLRKTGPLDESELEEIRLHPLAGVQLLAPIPAARAALPCVLYHHERWDGRGYPTRRAGTRIPIAARLLAIADAFDAMTSVRPYRQPFPTERAFEEIERCAGTQFDPSLAEAFLEQWDAAGSGARAAS